MSFQKLEMVLGDTVIPVLDINMKLPDVFLVYWSRGNAWKISLKTDKGFFLDV